MSSRVFLTSSIDTTVASFFTPTSKKEPEKVSWKTVNQTLLVGRYGELAREGKRPRKIAGFDFVSHAFNTFLKLIRDAHASL